MDQAPPVVVVPCPEDPGREVEEDHKAQQVGVEAEVPGPPHQPQLTLQLACLLVRFSATSDFAFATCSAA